MMELVNLNGSKKMLHEERRYSVPHGLHTPLPPAASEDLHAWSIYRQNLNSDFTDSALGSSDKSPLPYGNFQLRDTTVQSILNHPRYGPKSPLGTNMYTYLKFGLPRVFPPNVISQRSNRAGIGGVPGRINRGFRESLRGVQAAGSSGYDSSDNETTRSRMQHNLRKYRSESDFRAISGIYNSRTNTHVQQNIPIPILRQVHSSASIAAGTNINSHHQHNHYISNGNRSHSEADILHSGSMIGVDGVPFDFEDARVFGTPPFQLRHTNYTPHQQSNNIGLVYPNIQVHCLDVNTYLRGVSLQAKAGDLFAIMATSHQEGTALTECLAGIKSRLSGEVLVNGQQINRRGLRELCSYVPALSSSSLDPRMSVQCTLHFHAALNGSLHSKNIKNTMNALIEDLGLATALASNVASLTHSEKQRLSVACQLLALSPIVILDQVTNNMDIFDTFFLVEYLRQWSNGGRIVLMTLQPPTFEILAMCTGVLLLSGGRTIFSGSRSELPRHMAELGYPCPPFKNPADYYLDLVTLDDLSAAAMLESSARIDSLANSWDQINAEPPLAAPPNTLPNFIHNTGLWGQMKALMKRFTIYKQPGSLLNWITKLIVAALLSLCIGCIFWDVPSSDPQLNYNDRLGYHHCIIAVGYWPLVMLTIYDAQDDRRHAERDIRLGLYSRSLYIVIQSLFGLIPNMCIWLAYILPAHSMAGLYYYSSSNDAGIYLYLGYMILYFNVIHVLSLLCAHLMPTSISAILLNAVIAIILSAVGGYSVHPLNLSGVWSWLQRLSPEKWILQILVQDEFSADTLANSIGLQLCRNKQVQHQDIIVQHPCPPPNGTQVLNNFQLLPQYHVLDSTSSYERTTVLVLVATSLLLYAATFFIFLCNCRNNFGKKRK